MLRLELVTLCGLLNSGEETGSRGSLFLRDLSQPWPQPWCLPLPFCPCWCLNPGERPLVANASLIFFFFSLYILCFIFVQSVVSHCSQAVIELVTVLLPQPPECCEVTEASASPGSVSLLWSAVAGPREPQALGPGWADLPFLFLLR